MRKDEVIDLYPLTKKVNKNFDWKPKVKLIEGLKKTIKSYA